MVVSTQLSQLSYPPRQKEGAGQFEAKGGSKRGLHRQHAGGTTGTINTLVCDNLADGSSAGEQLESMQDKCAQAAELLSLHKKARQVQPREYIAGNKWLKSSRGFCRQHSQRQ